MSFIDPSDKLKSLPVYPFVRLEQVKEKARREGRDLVDLGIGDPDLPTPKFIIEAAKKALTDPENHRYPTSTGMLAFRAGHIFNASGELRGEIGINRNCQRGADRLPDAGNGKQN